LQGRIEQGACLEHGASDAKKTIRDRAEGTAVTVTSLTQGGVFEAATPIMLNGNSRPVVDRVRQAGMAGETADDNAAFAGTLGNGRDTAQRPQSVIISPLQSIPGFCEQRGENDPAGIVKLTDPG
jgi:hypothetical protein